MKSKSSSLSLISSFENYSYLLRQPVGIVLEREIARELRHGFESRQFSKALSGIHELENTSTTCKSQYQLTKVVYITGPRYVINTLKHSSIGIICYLVLIDLGID